MRARLSGAPPTDAAPDAGWIAAQRLGAARALRRATSAVDLVHRRDAFGWTTRPAPGSILASPRCAAWDPEPDYFYHWVRDAAIALRAVPKAIAAEPDAAPFWRRAVADHIAFSASLSAPGRRGPATHPLTAGTRDDHRRFLRPEAELAALCDALWRDEPRFAADGTPDLERWNRPQDDGPALRASAIMAVAQARPDLIGPEGLALIAADLAHTARVVGRPSIGPWEEAPPRRTSFTLIAQWDALDRGARWPALSAMGVDTGALAEAATRALTAVQETADAESGGWKESIEAEPGVLDSATVLAILHADRSSGPLALGAPRSVATVAALEALFRRLYPLNAGRTAPGIGRFASDIYFGGNPWFPVTLGFAELLYRLAAASGDPEPFAKAEAWMALVQEFAPAGDDLPEQFHRQTGAPESCLALTWSAAAFLGAAAARDAALQAIASR